MLSSAELVKGKEILEATIWTYSGQVLFSTWLGHSKTSSSSRILQLYSHFVPQCYWIFHYEARLHQVLWKAWPSDICKGRNVHFCVQGTAEKLQVYGSCSMSIDPFWACAVSRSFYIRLLQNFKILAISTGAILAVFEGLGYMLMLKILNIQSGSVGVSVEINGRIRPFVSKIWMFWIMCGHLETIWSNASQRIAWRVPKLNMAHKFAD